MSPDEILKKILENPELQEQYWPEITDPSTQNVNTLSISKNIYLRYLHTIFSEQVDAVRYNALANLIN
jgi:hypothetical protein